MKVTIGEHEFEAFTTTAAADMFLSADVARATAWALRQEAAKGRGLVSATRMLIGLPWCATAPDPAAAEQDDVLQEVTAMLAADLLAKPRLFADASGDSNVKIAKAGSAQVEFFRPVVGGPPLPKAMWNRLVSAGLVCLDADPEPDGDGPFVSGILGHDCRPLRGRYADACAISETE